ncbi:MAG: choice-of-anchor B family protein [Thermoanaerobaculia bacterium]|nr:choice-of-anchor B family protein [Thermoanaerobaculia bacterium]
MRSFFFLCCWQFAVSIFAQNVNVTFLSKTTYTGQTLSNIWGYAAGGREYALVGAKNGMIVMDVTNPAAPVQIVQISGASSQWREIKTYQHYAYVATEGGGGLQIVDLSPLPGASLPVYTYTGGGTTPATLNTIHALQVDEAKGFLYLYGSNLVGGRACVFDLNQNPTAPVYKGYYNPVGYAHDGYVNNDTMYAGHIYAGLVSVVDMTVKTGANDQIGVTLATPISTPLAFSHNTWRYGNTLFTTDERPNSTLAAYDISDLSNITLLDQIQSNPGSNSYVHNTYIRNGYAITSWYVDGFTIVDVSRPANLVQVGNYDTYSNTGTGFNGAWGVYPFLPSGNILVSNISGTSTTDGEMWVLAPNIQRGCYIEGLITDAVTGNPVAGATVQLLGTATSNNSNAFGNYKMGQLQSGAYTFQVTKSGYNPYTQTISISNGVLTTVNAALTPTSACSYVQHNSENFENAWGIWTDGGADCARINNATYANSVPYSIQLRDNTSTSVMTTTSQNCASYSEMKVSFSYIALSFDNSNEDFWLQISTNGGSSYSTVADFNYSIEFTNGVRKNTTVTIPGPFTSNTRFRFRADASADDDVVYIDDVVISGCQNSFTGGGGENVISDESNKLKESASDIVEIKTGPNPVSDFYMVQFQAKADAAQLDYLIMDMTGRVVLQNVYTCNEGYNLLNIDVHDLEKGTYILSLRTDKSRFAQKLILEK